MSRYNVLHPTQYPVGWLTAARQSLEGYRQGRPEPVSADWARGSAGAAARMARMRAFRDSLKQFPHEYPDLTAAMTEGLTMTFSRVLVNGVWDVRIAWKEVSNIEDILAKTLPVDAELL